MANQTLEERISRLEDIEAIKRLKHRYMEYGDAYDAEGIQSLFAPDMVFDGGEAFGRHESPEALGQMVRDAGKQISFAAHYAMNEIIDVNGDRATGKWWLFMPCTVHADGGGEARWLFAMYEDEYIRLNETWLIKKTKLDVTKFAPHLKGWADI